MRVDIDVDGLLMRQAMHLIPSRTKKEVIEAGLRLLVETHSQSRIRRFRGKVLWGGNLGRSRQGRIEQA
jgi:Arc/MetJ family transcription regulator